ncbi:MAG: hypothetical protein JW795_24070, partial [Chitinivibrionales bacterium]|nr:hypothetical protein [Chitinivibrionales bacterium]
YLSVSHNGLNSMSPKLVSINLTVNQDGCSGVEVWNAQQPWHTYNLGERRVDAGKLYECIDTAFSWIKPSSTDGSRGWRLSVTPQAQESIENSWFAPCTSIMHREVHVRLYERVPG